MIWSLAGLRSLIPAPTQLPTADLALRPLHRAGLVAGPRNGGVQYARLRTAVTLYTTGFQRNGLPDRRRADIGSPRGVLVPQYSELPSYRAIFAQECAKAQADNSRSSRDFLDQRSHAHALKFGQFAQVRQRDALPYQSLPADIHGSALTIASALDRAWLLAASKRRKSCSP